MSSPGRITYTPRPDTSPELEVAALVATYRYILDCHAKKKAVEGSGGEDATGGGDHEDGLNGASE
jgi:hypothetical protein